MYLTDTTVRDANPADKRRKISDGGGLSLLIHPNGRKHWRFRYRYEGKDRTVALGVYPDVSLKDARERRDAARKLLANGVDPGAQRKAIRAARTGQVANSFEAIAREWHARYAPTWSADHGKRVLARLEQNVCPWLGARPIADITAPELLTVLRRIEARGALETAHRTLQNCGMVFRFGVATGRCERDPSGDLRGALPPHRARHHASIPDMRRIGELLRSIRRYEGTLVTCCALRLAPLVFVRPGELRRAEWGEINLDGTEWRIPAQKMKMGAPHIVPLSTQAVAVLRELHPFSGHGQWVFPGARGNGRPMSNNTN